MIQFNLLPDVKIQYIKAQKQKNVVMTVSAISALSALALLAILILVVNVSQKNQLSSLGKEITTNVNKIKDTKDLDKILTIQNQLNSLTALHQQKPVVSRFYDEIIAKTVPDKIFISTTTLSFADTSLTFEGSSDKLETINVFVDTLKSAKYITGKNDDKIPSIDKDCNQDSSGNPTPGYHKNDQKLCEKDESQAFSQVTLKSFTVNEKDISYTITLNFDKEIFSGNYDVMHIIVHNIITTRSTTDQPGNNPIIKASPPPATPVKGSGN